MQKKTNGYEYGKLKERAQLKGIRDVFSLVRSLQHGNEEEWKEAFVKYYAKRKEEDPLGAVADNCIAFLYNCHKSLGK